jgi:hypothetical protein
MFQYTPERGTGARGGLAGVKKKGRLGGRPLARKSIYYR